MANEITITSTIRVNKGGTDLTFPSSGSPFTIDMTGTIIAWRRQKIGTSEEALDVTDIDIATGGAWVMFVNRDGTNFVEIRPGTGVADLIRMNAGEPAGPFRLTTTATAPFLIANTAECEVEYIIFDG